MRRGFGCDAYCERCRVGEVYSTGGIAVGRGRGEQEIGGACNVENGGGAIAEVAAVVGEEAVGAVAVEHAYIVGVCRGKEESYGYRCGAAGGGGGDLDVSVVGIELWVHDKGNGYALRAAEAVVGGGEDGCRGADVIGGIDDGHGSRGVQPIADGVAAALVDDVV